MRARSLLLVYLGLLADVLAFFYKPLFNDTYIFPWDFRYVQLPLISFLAEQLHRGRMAFWDPFTYCGDPIFANIQASFFHPLVFAAAWLSAHISLDSLPQFLEWAVALQIWIAGIAAYHLWRGMGAGTAGAFAGAVMFQTGGYFASQAEHIGAVMAVAWMPFAWLAILKLGERATGRWLAVLAGSLGMAVLGGFPQATAGVFGSTAMLAVVVVLRRIARPRLLGFAMAGAALGIALAGIQFIPTWQVTGYSVARYRAEWLGTGGGLYWQSLVSLLAPDYYHLFDLPQFKGPGDITFLYLYGSIAGLLLAVYALLKWRNPWVGVLGAMALFGALWMLGDKTPMWRWFYPMLPVSARIGIHPEYTYANFTLPLAGLAALGLDRLRVGNLVRWAVCLIIAVDLFAVGSGRPMNCSSVLEEPGLTREAFDGSADLLATVRSFANRESPPARIDTMDASINWAECATLTRVPTASGSSPLALENIIQLRLTMLAHPGVRWGWYYQVENPDSPVLDIMNVKYVLAGPKAVGRLRASSRYRHAASLPGYELFENLTVMPRYFLVHDVRRAGAEKLGEVDFHKVALVEDDIRVPKGEGAGQVRTLQYEPDSLELEVTSTAPAYLVMSEAFYPGWSAWIDGRRCDIHRTDIAFRGVVVPAGKHRLRMEFSPPVFRLSATISAGTFIILSVLVLFDQRSRRSSRR